MKTSETPPPRFVGSLLKWAKRLALGALILVVALGATFYLCRDWISAKANEIVKAELGERNIHLDYAASALSPTRGLVFSDVSIYRGPGKTDPRFSVSDIAFAFDWFRLITGGEDTPAVTSRSGTFVIHHPEKPVEITDLDAHVTIAPDSVQIDRFNGEVSGLRFALSGDLSTASPSEGKAAASEAEEETDSALADLDLEPVVKIFEMIEIDAGDAPLLVRGHVVRRETGEMLVTGSLSGENFQWKSIPVDALEAKFETEVGPPIAAPGRSGTHLRIPSLELGYGGKSLSGSGSYETATETVTIEDLRSKIDFVALLSATSSDLADSFSCIRFTEAPELTLSGTWPVDNPKMAALKGTLGRATTEISAGEGRVLRLSNLAANFMLAEGALDFSNLKVGMFGGSAGGALTVRPFDQALRWGGDLRTDRLSLQQIGDFTGSGQTQSGSLSVTFEGGGTTSLAGLTGGGRIEMAQADLRSNPTFRQLFPLLNSFIPGLNSVKGGMAASATYRLGNGLLSSDDARLEDELLIIDATASIRLDPGYVNFNAKGHTKGLTGMLTQLGIEGEGPFDNVRWQVNPLPNAGKVVGGLLKATGEATGLKEGSGEERKPFRRLKKLIPGKKD